MALIKTIEEAKEVLPKLLSSLEDDSFLPNIDATEEKYITPLIGDALYSDLQTKYDAVTLSADETLLVKHIRLVSLSYGFLDELIASHVVIGSDGVRTMDTTNMPKAVGWEYRELKTYLQDRAFDGTEILLKFLWKKKASFPIWTGSNEYAKFQGMLIRTGTDFNEQYGLYQPMRTFVALRAVVADAQDFYLLSGLGEDLLNYFLQIEDPGKEEKAIIKQLKKALANFTIKHAGDKYAVRFSENGFTIVNELGNKDSDDQTRTAVSGDLLEKKLKACDRDGKDFMAMAKKLLAKWRTSGSSSEAFNTAFDAGPLKSYVDPKEKKSGNERRKIFRF
jgi:hypothetical protein